VKHQVCPGNVLIVQRESAVCLHWREVLPSLGLSIQGAQSVRAAERFVAESPDWMDFLVIDPELPDGNCTPQFVNRILHCERPPVVAVILHQLQDASLLEMAYHGAHLVPKPHDSSSIRLLCRLLQRLRHTQHGVIAFARSHHLSPRETEVLEAQFNGISDKMIAQILNRTEYAINQTTRRIHKKLGASSFREIVSQWRRHVTDVNFPTDDVPPSSSGS